MASSSSAVDGKLRRASSRHVTLGEGPARASSQMADDQGSAEVTYRFGEDPDLQTTSILAIMQREDFFLRVLIPRQPTFHSVLMEPLSLLHRFFFTGVIHLIFPESRVQLWAGVLGSLLVLVGFQYTLPYASELCDAVQYAAFLQLLLTYISAFLFYDDGGLGGVNANLNIDGAAPNPAALV